MVPVHYYMRMVELSEMLKKIRMVNKYFVSALREKASPNMV